MVSGVRGSCSPLPPRWPQRVRAAIVPTFSLPQVSVTAAAEHVGEAARPLGEVVLLREELRIKDARMDRLPPYRRPHYPPVYRLAILELRAPCG